MTNLVPAHRRPGFLKRLRQATAHVFPRFGAFLYPYDAASTNTRRTTGWNPSTGDINTQIFGSLEVLRARSRDQVRRNTWGRRAVNAYVSNAIGKGIRPQSLHPDPAMRAAIGALWNKWVPEADADGLVDFYGIQNLFVRELMEAGECLIRKLPRLRSDGLSVPLQLRGLEPEFLPVWKIELSSPYERTGEGSARGNMVRGGIEVDKDGRRVAYYLYKEHPGSGATNPYFSGEILRVPASAIIHGYEPVRYGQMRGEPWLSQVLVTLWELEQYEDAELVAKKVQAMFAGFIEKASPEDMGLPGEQADPSTPDTAQAGLEPATLYYLMPGERFTQSTPPAVAATFETFIRAQLRKVAACARITYDMLTGDNSQANYSSMRTTLLQFRRECEQLQYGIIVHQVCRPIFRDWMDAAILSGALPMSADDPDRYSVRWVTPGWPWVDPLVDVRASVMARRAGFVTRSQIVSAQGDDIEQIDADIKAEDDRADKLKRKYDSDGRDQPLPGESMIAKGQQQKPAGASGVEKPASGVEKPA